ncbi:MAG: GAF domain-containing protein, partial [Verrucomicrobiaceae bacterium]
MHLDDSPDLEVARLGALQRYNILDTPPEAEFDDLARLAANICHAPIAAISLLDGERQWLKAAIGLSFRETPIDIAICKHALLQKGVFVVQDTASDPRFQNNPLVSEAPHLRFYAGALLESSEGLPLGTLCVWDYQPRQLTEAQTEALSILSRQVMHLLELRLSRARLQETLQTISDAFFTLDHGCRFTYVSPLAEALLKVNGPQLLGRLVWDESSLGKNDGFAGE